MSGSVTLRDAAGDPINNANGSVLQPAARTTTATSDTFTNRSASRLHLVIDVTVTPGVDTVTPKIEGYDPISGKYYTLLTGAAISSTGTTILKIGPGLAASANVSAADFLPRAWRVVMTHSAATSFTYSVAANTGI